MTRLSTEKVLQLHEFMAAETGGSVGVREIGLLESALESAFACFGGEEFYPTIEEKAARLGYSLMSNHAFVDGNKRIGMFAMLIFLEANGIKLDCTNADIVSAGLGVADGSMTYKALLNWVRWHSDPTYKSKYWEGRTPPVEYFQSPEEIGDMNKHLSKFPEINYQELLKYCRETGRQPSEVGYEEMQQFVI